MAGIEQKGNDGGGFGVVVEASYINLLFQISLRRQVKYGGNY